MHLPDFDYYAPSSVDEACKLLAELGDKAVLYSGGTDLLPKMKHEKIAPEAVVAIKKIESLSKIEYVAGTGLVIGGAATINGIVFSDAVRSKYASICEAARSMANNQVRHAGTVAGNIANATPSADMPPILIALGAKAEVVGPNGTRTLLVEEIPTGPSKTQLAHAEIITKIIIPDNNFTGSKYFKFGLRRSGALAVVGVAAAVQVEGDVIKDAKIVLGAVAATPVRAKEAEKSLIGKKISDDLLKAAGEIAKTECKPITDFRASADYRTDLVSVFTKRALRAAIDNGHN